MDTLFEEAQHKKGQKFNISGLLQIDKKGNKDSDPMYESKFIFCCLMLLEIRLKSTTTNIPGFKGECPNEDQLLDADAQQIHCVSSPQG